MPGANSFTRFIFILVDCSPYKVFNNLVEDDTVSNIKNYVIDRRTFKRAVSTFPCTTGPDFIPFFIGLLPRTANVPAFVGCLGKSSKIPTDSAVQEYVATWE